MIPISSIQNPTIKQIRALENKKERREQGRFVVEGLAMLEKAEALGLEPDIIVATKKLVAFPEIRPFLVTEKLMAELSQQNNPHEVMAVFKQRWQPHPEKEGFWLALEEIRDPGNLGTILRSAEAVGVAGIILVGDCCDPYSSEAVRASTGSIFGSKLVRMNKDAMVNFARSWKGDVVGTAAAAKHDYRSPVKAPCLLVMGSEGKGLSADLSKACNKMLRIPMKPAVESLNVAIATSLMLYAIGGSSI